MPEDDGHWDTAGDDHPGDRARGRRRLRLDGRKSFVLDGHTADLIIVAAQADGGPSLFAVAGDADGLTRQPLETLDLTRKLARLELAAARRPADRHRGRRRRRGPPDARRQRRRRWPPSRSAARSAAWT